MKITENDVCRISAEAVSAIDFLTKRDEFRAFMEYFQKRADELADDVLHNDSLSDREREAARMRRAGILEVLRWPMEQREAHVRVLAQYGHAPGDGIEVGL